jgi:hypothetical protein
MRRKTPDTVTRGHVTFTKARALKEILEVNQVLKKGHHPTGEVSNNKRKSALSLAAERLGVGRLTLKTRVGTPETTGTYEKLWGLKPNWEIYENRPHAIPRHVPVQAYTGIHGEQAIEIVSRPDNTFLFGAAGDLHAASKYTRWDVREDLYRIFIEEGAQCSFDTGNWIDGESRFNTYDIEAHGLESQCRLLARQHPKGLRTYAVWGDDHEGWYVQREGIDVGRYNEDIMQREGHDWVNLGFMEAHVILRNANTGKTATMAVVHPGGGSAYALSYSIQKIIESLEGGEKPAVGLYGHYHKQWAGLIRNVWCLQTACQQDQTPFMRKKRLEAHVGGSLVKLRQDPETGVITSFVPELFRYFNAAYYGGSGRWSKHGPVTQLSRARTGVRKKR